MPFVGNGVCFIDGPNDDQIKLVLTAEEGQPTSIAGTIQTEVSNGIQPGETLMFTVHQKGDITNSCQNVGSELETMNNIADATYDPIAPMFSQDDWMQAIGPIIGNSIVATKIVMGVPETIGCCVIGKGMPPMVMNDGI